MKFLSGALSALLVMLWAGILHAATMGSFFLTGHDPDFHAAIGGNTTGARNINTTAIDFILDPTYNAYSSSASMFLFVEAKSAPLPGHTNGVNGIVASGYTLGTDFEHHDATTLAGELALLGTKYAGIVVASDFGGMLTSAELDILNASSSIIIDFLNSGGGIYAMAESNGGSHTTTGSTPYGFLPFLVSSTSFDQAESGVTVTSYGAGLGLTNADVNGNFSHNIFTGSFGLNVVDRDSSGNILTLAGRGRIIDDGVVVPLPATAWLMLVGLGGLGVVRRTGRRKP